MIGNDVRNEIILAALILCKAHTNWKTGKGSVQSFSQAKTKFAKGIEDILSLIKSF